MGTIFVDLDARLRLGFRVGISADVLAFLYDEDFLAGAGHAFCDGEPEESGSDHKEVIFTSVRGDSHG